MRRIEYCYHPRYGAEVGVVRAQRSFAAQIDIVRFDDGEQIALPRWMLDAVYCAQLAQEPKPRVAVSALLRLADWMAAQGLLGCRAAGDFEDSAPMKTNQAEHVYIATGLLALFLCAGLWAQSPKSDSSPKVPQAWQHLALEHEGRNVTGSPDLARKINSLGDEGWQLVDVESISEADTTTKIIFFFKRLK